MGLAIPLASTIANPWAVCPSLPRRWDTGLLQISKNEASLRIAAQHMHRPTCSPGERTLVQGLLKEAWELKQGLSS